MCLLSPVLSHAAETESAHKSSLELVSIGFVGEGRNPLLATSTSGTDALSGPFAEPGSRLLENPAWVAGTRSDPVSYVSGSQPRLLVRLRSQAGQPAGHVLELAGNGTTGADTFHAGPTRFTATGESGQDWTLELPLKGLRLQGVDRLPLSIQWQARTIGEEGQPAHSLGESSTLCLVTWSAPAGEALGVSGAVSAVRLDYLTNLAAGRHEPIEIVTTLGSALTHPSRYKLESSFNLGSRHARDPFSLLDGGQADCRTLSVLMKQALDLLGVPGAEVRFVYPRTGSWDGLSSSLADQSQRRMFKVDLFGNQEEGTLVYDDHGPNRYQACCVWTGIHPSSRQEVTQWWMGGKGTFVATDFDVLMHATGVLRSDPAQSRQLFLDDLTYPRQVFDNGPVPFPSLPSAFRSTVKETRQALLKAGYRHVVVVERDTWIPWMAGRVLACYPLGVVDGMPVSPHRTIIIEVARS